MRKILASFGVAAMLVGVGGFGGGAEAYAVEASSAQNTSSGKNVCNDDAVSAELKQVAGCEDFKLGEKKTAVPIALNIINIVLTFVGLVAVGMIAYGGVLYAISTGDAGKMAKGKVCVLYGIVGLVVAIMAYAIVAFVNVSVLKK